MNFDYTVRGADEHIRPVRVFDDGMKTYIQMPVELRELSAGVRKSEAVASCHPIMPVGDSFGGRVVRINSRQL